MSGDSVKRRLIGPWTALAAFLVLWVIMFALGPSIRGALSSLVQPKTVKEILAFRLATGLPLSWVGLAGTLLLLRLRGQTARDVGWRKPVAIWGWLAALVVTAFYLWGSFRTPICRGLCFIDPTVWFSDWSVFRLATSICIGVTAGVCEETAFRGFVMTQARDGRAPLVVQILLSGLLFGLAHLGIAGLSGTFIPAVAFSVVPPTAIFGIIFATIYVLGGRSLTHVILAHGLFAFVTEPWMLLWGMEQTMRHVPA